MQLGMQQMIQEFVIPSQRLFFEGSCCKELSELKGGFLQTISRAEATVSSRGSHAYKLLYP